MTASSIPAPRTTPPFATAVLLVNLGTPAAPTAGAIRRYLAEFLSDPRVVQLPRWLWWPLLHGFILPLRARRVARKYAAIWRDDGSPLAVYTRNLADAMQQRLAQHHVSYAMRYGEPALAQALRQLQASGTSRVLVLPLYPQYSMTTTASVADLLATSAVQFPAGGRMVEGYHRDAGWIATIADSIRAYWRTQGRGEHLLLSFHGIPQRLVDAGDPYARQCEASANAIAAALNLEPADWTLAYQSRFGRERWLQPSTSDVLDALAARHVRAVDVVCPGFAVDCLETLEEIAIMLAERFAAHGGKLHYIPCLNASSAHAETLTALVQRELAAW